MEDLCFVFVPWGDERGGVGLEVHEPAAVVEEQRRGDRVAAKREPGARGGLIRRSHRDHERRQTICDGERRTHVGANARTVDASHTVTMLLTPQGDFSYVAASGNTYVNIAPAAEVPEPATMLLLGSGLAFGARRVRHRGRFSQ